VRIVVIGDVFAAAGIGAVERHLPALRAELDADLVVANGENAADGAGITQRYANRLFTAGVDVITLGNHTWRRDGVGVLLATEPRIIRPANYLASLPGRGLTVVEARDGTRVAVINVLGAFSLQPACSPFQVIDPLIEEARRSSAVILVDVHAEATSEKIAMGWHLDGRATCVFGTHTHVQTSDARVLPKGTAYVTDVGMTGPHDGVIGTRREIILRRFLTQLPQRHEAATGDVRIEGLVVDCDPGTGRATRVEAFRRDA
jgi:metallophosphoesterase (TIGR00282 family)